MMLGRDVALAVAGLVGAVGLAGAALLHPRSPLGRPRHHLSPGAGLALSFDDGPDPRWTPAVLAALARHGLRASFFVVGAQIERAPGLVRELAAAGHRVEVHGLHHRFACFQRPGALADELARMRERIAGLTGRAPRWYRPPYGARPLRPVWAGQGLALVTWSWACGDWAGGERHGRPLRPVRDGDIVLLHDGPTPEPGARARTLAAIEALAARELRAGPLADPA
ncbi:MAG: polysaccharide deacetylase family protein [Myxococcales bacterium]|nr:polysaccharide deacetylase family protein [Myxococcales bacterium]